MRLATVPLVDALGSILVHNIPDAQGHKLLNKGHKLSVQDLETLQRMGRETVYVALLDEDDVREDDAVGRIAQAVCGSNLEASKPSGGRSNLLATSRGVFTLDPDALLRLNSLRGITVSTRNNHSVAAVRQMVATVKTIGLALPRSTVVQAEAIAAQAEILRVVEFTRMRVAVILTGDLASRARVEKTFTEPITGRVAELGAAIISSAFVPEDEEEIAGALASALGEADVVILAGETSIMDEDDVTPRAIRRAGGRIEAYGAPVEPGNLVLLAYCGDTPVLGAPGCVKSRETNIVDLLLPRLLAGEKVTRGDIARMGEGGLRV